MAKIRMTKQRKTIMKILKNTNSHPTADTIYEEVKKEIPKISLGTVYRNLNLLEELNEIMVINYTNAQSHYDGVTKNHYHFRCNNCGRVFDLDLDVLDEDVDKYVEKNTDFQIDEHRLEFYGLCPDCQK